MLFSKIVNVSSLCKQKEPKRLKESDGSSKNLKNIHILNAVSDNTIFPLQNCTSGLVWSVSFLNSTPPPPRKNLGHVSAKLRFSSV